MQRILIVGVLAVLLFAASAGVSWYLRWAMPVSEKTQRKGNARSASGKPDVTAPAAPLSGLDTERTGGAASPPALLSSPPAVRPPYQPEAESMAHLAENLKKQTEATQARQRLLDTRRQSLELIQQDIRGERAAIERLRKQISEEAVALEAKLVEIEKKAGEVTHRSQTATQKIDELKRSMTAYEGLEHERIKQLALVYERMEPDKAARVLQQWAESNQLDIAVKILAQMKDRQAARVLDALGDPAVAAELLKKLRGLKMPPAVTTPQ